MNPDSLSEIQQELAQLRSRVQVLEDAVRRVGILRPPVQPQPAPQFRPASIQPAQPPLVSTEASAPAAPSLAAATAAPAAHDRSLESRIGSQWFNRIGIIAVLIGMSWFLKFAIDNHWIGPLGRVVIGLIAGTGLVGWSEQFHKRGYPAFAYSLKAVGSGILYLSLWAAFSLFHLMPSSVAFAAMIAVTAFNGFMSWRQNSELLALYSIVGGLSTPLLLSTGENHELALFSYLLLLDLAVLVLVALRPWSRLLFAAFTGTVLFFLGWGFSFYSDEQFARTAFFLSCYFLLFAFAPRLIRPNSSADSINTSWDRLALVLMPIANAAAGFLGFYALLDRTDRAWAQPWTAIAFAAFYLLLHRLPGRGVLHQNSQLSSSLQLTTAVVFLAVAIPLKAHGRWLTIGWLIQGAALLWIAQRISQYLLRILAILCLALGLGALVLINPPAAATPILNERFATYCVAIAIFIFIAWLARMTRAKSETETAFNWPAIGLTSALIINLLILLAIGWEIHSYWWFVRWHGNWNLMHDYRMYAQFTYSAFFMIFGAILLTAGVLRRSAFVRWQALILLAASIAKVFLVDVSTLSQGYRIISFLGLGILLLAVSFVYQRDWLHLRVPEREVV